MNFVNHYIKPWAIYLVLSLVIIAFGTIVLASTEKVDFHLCLNSLHSDFQDPFFRYFTHLGDGYFVTFAGIALVAITWKKKGIQPFVLGASALLTCGAVIQFLKHAVFHDALRPSKFIVDQPLYLIPGLEMNGFHAFPSGHTAAAFTFWAFVAYSFGRNNKWVQVLCVIIAALVGYSRIYLSQHFLEDVVAGAALGLCFFFFGLMCQCIFARITGKSNETSS